MASTEEDVNPYELLGVTLDVADGDIRKAYRQRSLKVHPDRNPNNPDAARKFHELNQAYELLLDPLRRMALDAKLRIKEARKARFSQYDNKRKNLVEELEERERAFKKAKTDKEEKQKQVWRDNERIMEEGRLMRETREKELLRREEEAQAESKRMKAELEPPALGTLDTTIRLKWTLTSYPNLTDSESISKLLHQFGGTDNGDILVSLKPAPPKKPKRGTAVVPFRQIGDAFAAVCASGREDRGLHGVEIDWAEGREPPLIEWLKKMGKLGSTEKSHTNEPMSTPVPTSSWKPSDSEKDSQSSTPFSSFPSTFPDILTSSSTPPSTNVAGLDYESLTLMRLRQAERERLEREILEQESQQE